MNELPADRRHLLPRPARRIRPGRAALGLHLRRIGVAAATATLAGAVLAATPLADQPVFREHFDGIETVDRSDPESGGVSGLLDLDTQPDDGDTRADGGRAGRTPGGNRPAWLIPAIIGGVVLVVIVIAATLFRGS